MTFAHPAFLWLFAALAPVFAAFLVRRRRARVVRRDMRRNTPVRLDIDRFPSGDLRRQGPA